MKSTDESKAGGNETQAPSQGGAIIPEEGWGAIFEPGPPSEHPPPAESLPASQPEAPRAKKTEGDEIIKPANRHKMPPPAWMKPAVSVAAVIDEVAPRFEKMEKDSAEFRAGLKIFLDGQPQSIPCEKHPDKSREIDLDLSIEASWPQRQFRAEYRPCPDCSFAAYIERTSGWLSDAGVPELFLNAHFETFRCESESDRQALTAAKEFAQMRRGFLVMTGKAGDGKSYLAVAIMRAFRGGLFLRHSELLILLRRGYGDAEATKLIEKAQKAKLLVLDDIEPEPLGVSEARVLFNILDHRYADKLATILTCNCDYQPLMDFLGPRMADRMRQCLFRKLAFTGQSSRSMEQSNYFES